MVKQMHYEWPVDGSPWLLQSVWLVVFVFQRLLQLLAYDDLLSLYGKMFRIDVMELRCKSSVAVNFLRRCDGKKVKPGSG